MAVHRALSSKPTATETLLYRPVVPLPDAVSVAWVYPYTDAVAMSSLGYLSLFKQLDTRADVSVQRVTTDSIKSQTRSDMDLMGFSFSFELDILKILHLLETAGLAFYAAERSDTDPLVFAGGPVVITNPEPYADFFDFFLIGEGEDLLDDLIPAFKAVQHLKSRREKLLALAERVPGIYIPSFYTVDYTNSGEIRQIAPQAQHLPFPVEKRLTQNLDKTIAASPLLTPNSVFSNTYLVEVMRGCAHRCRFCLASYSMLPARGPTLDKIIETLQFGLQHTPRIGLVGALIAEHPEFEALCRFLRAQPDIQVSAASLRADTLTPEIAETFHHGGQKQITLAIETGSEKLRKRINKHLKTEAILEAAAITAAAGLSALKLYTMIGLPDETQTDLVETVGLIKDIKQYCPRLKLVVGCSTFVPKAATPFQWMAREPVQRLQEKHRYLQKALVGLADFRPSSPKWDAVQALLSRGDRRLSGFLVSFYQHGGNLGAVNRAYKDLGLHALPDTDWYALRERPETEVLPWETLFLGVSKKTLFQESGLLV